MSKVYSDEDLCEYTLMQQIQSLQKQLDELKASVGAGLESKEDHDKDISDVRSDLYSETSLLHSQFTQGLAEANANIENVNKVVPTDIGVKDGKLGLLHDTKWLTNQGALQLKGLTSNNTDLCGYEVFTLTASQASDIQGYKSITLTDEQVQLLKSFNTTSILIKIEGLDVQYVLPFWHYGDYYAFTAGFILFILDTADDGNTKILRPQSILSEYYFNFYDNSDYSTFKVSGDYSLTLNIAHINGHAIVSDTGTPTDPIKQISLFGNHSILVPSDSSDSDIDLYRHDIVMEADSANSFLYLTIISSNNLVVDSVTDLKTLLSTTDREISCSGTKMIDSVYYPINSIHWEGNAITSKIYINYTDSINGESIELFSDSASIRDVVTTL